MVVENQANCAQWNQTAFNVPIKSWTSQKNLILNSSALEFQFNFSTSIVTHWINMSFFNIFHQSWERMKNLNLRELFFHLTKKAMHCSHISRYNPSLQLIFKSWHRCFSNSSFLKATLCGETCTRETLVISKSDFANWFQKVLTWDFQDLITCQK